MPTQLDGVSATVNGKAAFVYYIRPLQVNILTPPDAMSGSVAVRLNYAGQTSSRVHGADASVGFVVLRVRRRALRVGGARQWHVHRADDVIPRGDHAGETGRDDLCFFMATDLERPIRQYRAGRLCNRGC